MRILPGNRVVELPFTDETAIVASVGRRLPRAVRTAPSLPRARAGDRAAAGEVTGWRAIARTPWRSFRESYVTKRGYRDGATGLTLSLFWAGFRTIRRDRSPARAAPAGASVSGRAAATAIIASRNEARLLDQRLPELAFCDEVIVIDIDSTDDTAAVAEAHGARVIKHAFVPIAEIARAEVAGEARHDWLVLVDPDEEIPPALAAEATAFLRDAPDDVAVVLVGWVFHFRGRPLRGTIWGGTGRRPFLVRRSGVDLSTAVHTTLSIRPGFRTAVFEPAGDNVILHYWANGYRDWLSKHRRYVRLEGASRPRRGSSPATAASLARRGGASASATSSGTGYRDGLTGLALSVLWAWYETAAEIELLRELRRRAPG